MSIRPVAASGETTSATITPGNQNLVYNAIAKGHKLVGEIMEKTGLDEDTVRTAIGRLRDAGDVARERIPGQRLASYYARGKACLLAEVWK